MSPRNQGDPDSSGSKTSIASPLKRAPTPNRPLRHRPVQGRSLAGQRRPPDGRLRRSGPGKKAAVDQSPPNSAAASRPVRRWEGARCWWMAPYLTPQRPGDPQTASRASRPSFSAEEGAANNPLAGAGADRGCGSTPAEESRLYMRAGGLCRGALGSFPLCWAAIANVKEKRQGHNVCRSTASGDPPIGAVLLGKSLAYLLVGVSVAVGW